MYVKKLFLLLACGLCAHSAWASSDYYCAPSWTLIHRGYSPCSNVPILTPGNDTRVNLKLLLVDEGFAKLQVKPVTKEDAEYDYGKVPFSLESFENGIFISNDKRGGSTNEIESFSHGEGTRCISNENGKADFVEAVGNSKDLSKAERHLLTEARQKLNPSCVDKPASGTADFSSTHAKSILSATGKQFMQYLTAANAFYEGRYGEAESVFSGLMDSHQPWIKETALYMLGRTGLNLSQQNAFDSYGFPQLDKVDQKALLAAEVKLNNYLKKYPGGRYSSSARGLLRRIYWLSNQPQKLADEYEWQMKHPESPQYNLSLNEFVWEADSKLLGTVSPDTIKNPLMLATIDLSLMRSDASGTKQISYSDLQKQKSLFVGHRALYEYLLAAHRFYVQKDAANALKALNDKIPPHMTYTDFSRLTLRGLALESIKDHGGARQLWLKLLPVARQPLQTEALQLALAINYEQSTDLKTAFEPNSPISEAAIRTILLRSDAAPELLRHVIAAKDHSSNQERLVALYTLLYKDLLQGQYQSYIQDYRLLPGNAATTTHSPGTDSGSKPPLALFSWTGKETADSYDCPSTLKIAEILAKNAHDPFGLLCLGDFVNSNDLESGSGLRSYSAQPSSDAADAVLGSAPSRFPGIVFSRGEGYKTVIADNNAAPDMKAYALYRSIKCYANAGYNHCGGETVEKSVRKSWFQTLKKRYPDSEWAQSLKYYW